MKAMKVSELKDLLSMQGVKDEDLITKRSITKLFKTLGDDYDFHELIPSYSDSRDTYKEFTLREKNVFKEVLIGGESK